MTDSDVPIIVARVKLGCLVVGHGTAELRARCILSGDHGQPDGRAWPCATAGPVPQAL